MREGWEIRNIEECIDQVKYPNKVPRKSFLEEGQFPIISQEQEYINGYWSNEEDLLRLEKPVVIFGDHTKVLKFIDFDFVLGADGVKVLQPKDFLDPKFFYYFLNAFPVKDLGYARHYRLLKELEVQFPRSLPEQEAIAEALSDTDALIESLEQLIAKKRQIKQGAMQELLTGKKRLPGFQVKSGYKQTAVGMIPENWEVRQLTSFADVRDGTHDSPKYTKRGVPFITSKNIVSGRLSFDNIELISEEDAHEVNKRSKVNRDDILLSMIGTVGNAALVDFEPEFCIKNVALIKPKSSMADPRFLIQLFRSDQYVSYIVTKLDGGIQKFISLGVLRGLDAPLPPTKAEQEAIAELLGDMDAEITELEAKLAKTYKLKQGMMRELLTGRIRLI